MPATNDRKIYLPQSPYHIYNRGAFKLPVFRDSHDFEFFYTLLYQEQINIGIQINVESVLPNHFHLQIFQNSPREMQRFMSSVGIRYSFYFRKKYQHSGRIFQGNYRAALLLGRRRIQENTFYILDNPENAGLKRWPYVGRFTKWRENFS